MDLAYWDVIGCIDKTRLVPSTLQTAVLDKHKEIFNDELAIGTVKDAAAKFQIDPQAMPKFYKP